MIQIPTPPLQIPSMMIEMIKLITMRMMRKKRKKKRRMKTLELMISPMQ